MNKPYSRDFSQSIIYSRKEAMRLHNVLIRPEHFVLGILREGSNRGAFTIAQLCPDVSVVREALEQYLSQLTEFSVTPHADNEYTLEMRAARALKNCITEAEKQGDDTVRAEHLLLAILSDQQTEACQILNHSGITYDLVSKSLSLQKQESASHLDFGEDEEEDDDRPDSPTGSRTEERTQERTHRQKSDTPFLDKYGVDITRNASEGKLDPVVGRTREIERIAQILSRRKKNNPVLIGEPGVGKTAIVEGLAERIVKMEVPMALIDKRIVALDMSSLVAGTKYRGQFEERIQGIIRELTSHPDVILFIDEIHTIVGAGSAAGSMDAANILKPALSRGTLQCIGATTLDEYRKSIEKDGALERRFQKILVNPSTSAETLQILHNIKGKYEEHHHVIYTDEALEACVKLTDRYITDRQQPDKAIDALDEAGSRVHIGEIKRPDALVQLNQQLEQVNASKMEAVKVQDFQRAAQLRDQEVEIQDKIRHARDQWESDMRSQTQTVGLAEVEQTVSLLSGVPVQRVAADEGVRLSHLKDDLTQHIIHQDEAITKLVKAITRNRIGLRDPNRPIGTFMFLGPTGVGKTYLAQQLATYMFGSKDALIRIDMSEYMEKYSTSRLVGAPPGYVGYEEGGQLTEQVRRHPYSIVLLDEIEKASHDVFNLLLQVMDEGRLTDSQGVTVDFRNTIIIFTSNAGSKEVSDFGRGVGFNAGAEASAELQQSLIMKSLQRQFAPEFLNRIDDVILFNPLDREAVAAIAHLEIDKLRQRMQQMGYSLEIGPKALDFIVDRGYDPKYGARPLRRAIQEYLEDGVGNLILEGQVHNDGVIHVSKRPGKEELAFA
ncbi:MAG: ATP-dependent Clp protease ATP-binding subunit [Prevotellaceae bacterium]|nr:ATP-dependent Clp protease ATP-binding subunit [Prevotellaceae bacterium]